MTNRIKWCQLWTFKQNLQKLFWLKRLILATKIKLKIRIIFYQFIIFFWIQEIIKYTWFKQDVSNKYTPLKWFQITRIPAIRKKKGEEKKSRIAKRNQWRSLNYPHTFHRVSFPLVFQGCERLPIFFKGEKSTPKGSVFACYKGRVDQSHAWACHPFLLTNRGPLRRVLADWSL